MKKCNTFCTGQPCKNIFVYSLTLANKFTPALFFFFNYKTKKTLKSHVQQYSVGAKMVS